MPQEFFLNGAQYPLVFAKLTCLFDQIYFHTLSKPPGFCPPQPRKPMVITIAPGLPPLPFEISLGASELLPAIFGSCSLLTQP